MRDRLIELLEAVYKNPKVRCPRSDELTCEGCKYDLGDQCNISAIIADHLLESGVIVPPCKVGQVVYVLRSKTSNGKNLYLRDERISHYRVFGDWSFMCFESERLSVPEYLWGKTVFLTREEAEKALAERSNDNGN